MKITDRFKRKETKFRYVDVGAVFKHEKDYYIATVEIEENFEHTFNCLNLETGEHCFFGSDDKVEVLDAELIIK